MRACAVQRGGATASRLPASRDIGVRVLAGQRRRCGAPPRSALGARACTAARRAPCLISVPDAAAALESTFFEVAVQSRGRPAAAALADFVAAASAAFVSGHAPPALDTYIEELSTPRDARAGPRLTAGEAEYRTQWLWVVHETLRLRGAPSRGRHHPRAAPPDITDQVAAVLHLAAAGVPGAAALDAALATRAAREDPAAPRSTLAAHWLPVKQLVLLTCALAAEECDLADEDDD